MTDRRILVAEMTKFLAAQNLTHYITLTYPHRRSWEGRYKAFLEWINAIERTLRRPVGWFRADEYRYSGLGFPEIPEHHHGLLIDADHLSCDAAESLWRASVGDALVLRYESDGGAIEYCLKHAFHRNQDWDLGGKALRSFRYLKPGHRSKV